MNLNRQFNIDAGILTGVVLLGGYRQASGSEDDSPDVVKLTGVVRDFQERTADGGHPDFERRPDRGFGHYVGNVGFELGDDRKPEFTGDGRKVRSQYRDADGRQIAPHMYGKRYEGNMLVDAPDVHDSAGELGASDPGGIDSSGSFEQWFRDVPGVNISRPLTLDFHRQPDGTYVFDDKDDEAYAGRGGFFPIDDDMYGNSAGTPDHNFHFTFELHTTFTYDADGNQFFRFLGDDDVWVYIDGKLAIDLGGVHAATEQQIDLSRLGLTDGQSYTLDFFFAERHRTQSNVRIETNLELESAAEPMMMTMAFD